MNNHQSGVTPENFAKDPKLSSFFNLLSTNVDRQGRAFGSSMEGAPRPPSLSFMETVL
jgi:gamma-glutamyl hydrolase